MTREESVRRIKEAAEHALLIVRTRKTFGDIALGTYSFAMATLEMTRLVGTMGCVPLSIEQGPVALRLNLEYLTTQPFRREYEDVEGTTTDVVEALGMLIESIPENPTVN